MEDPTIMEHFTEVHFQSDLGMYYCGKRIRTPNHTYGPLIKQHYLLVLVNQGSAVISNADRTMLHEHDLFIMCPGENIHYKALEPWSISWLGLYGDTVSEYMKLLGVSADRSILHISLYPELKAVMDKIYEASQDTSLSSRLAITGYLYEFLSVLMLNSAIEPKSDFIDAALKIMDYNFCENISVEQIARRLNVDPAYFSRKFAETTGVSPKKYLLNKRIECAKELLLTTTASIFEISNSVGYEDSFYFCRIFSKYTGTSPLAYRKNAQNNTADIS